MWHSVMVMKLSPLPTESGGAWAALPKYLQIRECVLKYK